jgi:CxxC motif-containing protein (DUF1111 family)
MSSCDLFEPEAPADYEILDGPVEGLTYTENLQFLRGDVAFNDEIFTTETGLGPLFIATSCGSCHPGDGKGHPFTTLTRFGQEDGSGNLYLSQGGPQLQHRAIPGFVPEQIPLGATSTKLTPPANTGLGFLDAVTDFEILEYADPDDLDEDLISGVPNWITLKEYVTPRPGSVEQDGKYIGRFGKKGSTYDLLQQTAQAYNQDIGITSGFEPFDTYSGAIVDPEVSNQTIHDVVVYLKTLKAPVPRSQTGEILEGKQIFTDIGCGKCHRETMTTGNSAIAALANKTFHPYTDLLLHDMGAGLDDQYTEGSAGTFEWRTPPLWGLGLSKNSQGGEYFLLHDGRARSIDEAIVLHGGEALQVRNNYTSLSSDDKQKLIKFLESL